MSERFPVDIAALRQIGWDHWDPIGIRRFNDTAWLGAAADEYDTYLRQAADILLKGATIGEASAYLDKVVSDDMELGESEASRRASLRTAEAISAYMTASASNP